MQNEWQEVKRYFKILREISKQDTKEKTYVGRTWILITEYTWWHIDRLTNYLYAKIRTKYLGLLFCGGYELFVISDFFKQFKLNFSFKIISRNYAESIIHTNFLEFTW